MLHNLLHLLLKIYENQSEMVDFLHCKVLKFGVAVKNKPQLEKELLNFNSIVISKGLRKDAGPGLEVWCSDDVRHYNLKKA